MKRLLTICLTCTLLLGLFSATVAGLTVEAAEGVETQEAAITKPASLEEWNAADPADIAMLPQFDAREYGVVTNVKDQGSYNLCWAFSLSAVAETAILKAGLSDLTTMNNNPQNPVNLAIQYVNACSDPLGNFIYKGGTFLQPSIWDDALNTNLVGNVYALWRAPADGTTENAYIGPVSDYYMKTYVTVLAGLEGAGEAVRRQAIKEAIARYGSTSVLINQYLPDSTYIHATTDYKNSHSGEFGEHVVTIVGWDDTIPKEKFGPEQPSKDGAWIVRNSWGAYRHSGGYYYLSYEFLIGDGTSMELVSGDTWDNNYYYDGFPGDRYNGLAYVGSDTNTKGGVIFEVKKSTPTQKEILEAVNVGVYEIKNEGNCTVSIYKNVDPTMGDPTCGDFVLSKTVKMGCRGYYTIELDEPLELEAGTYFGVVVEQEGRIRKDGQAVSASALAYYYDYNNSEWVNGVNDVGGTSNYVPRIKAYTRNEDREETLEDDLAFATVRLPETTYEYCGEYHIPLPAVSYGGETLNLGTDYVVSYNDNLIPGTATVTVTGIGHFKGTKQVYFTITKGKIPPNCPGTVWQTGASLARRAWTLSGTYEKYGEILLPDDYVWLDISKNTTIEEGYTECAATFQYVGADASYYEQTMFDVYMTYTRIAGTTRITDSDVTLLAASFAYTGQPVTAGVTVKVGGTVLAENTDYILTYENNTAVGTATVTVTGLGQYSGTVIKQYTISSLPTEDTPQITIDFVNETLTGFDTVGSYTINGSAVSPKNGTLDVTDYIGTTISIVKKGGDSTLDSQIQYLAVPSRPDAPTLKINTVSEGVRISNAYCYSFTSDIYDETWNTGANITVPVTSGAAIYICSSSTTRTFRSAVQTLTAPNRETEPDVRVDYLAETLSTAAGIEYSTDNGDSWQTCTAGMSAAAFDWDGSSEVTVRFRAKATQDNYASNAVSCIIPARPDAPNKGGFTVTQPIAGGTGSIEGITSDMEYSTDKGKTWVTGTGAAVSGIADGATCHVRVKATSNGFKSDTCSILITSSGELQEAIPDIDIDYENEMLTGFEPYGKYTINGDTVTPTDGTLDVTEYMGRTISIVKKGGENTTDSNAQQLAVPSRPEAPKESDFTVTEPAEVGGSGRIAGIRSNMEWSTDGGSYWRMGMNLTINVTGGKTCLVRIKATDSSFKSGNCSIKMPVYLDPAEPFPDLNNSGTYWFDLSGAEIPGTVNEGNNLGAVSVPDTTLHWVPFTYTGNITAYVLNSNSKGKPDASIAAAGTTDKDGEYGYTYDHCLFVSQYVVKHTVSWTELDNNGLIFGRDYTSGGVTYTMRAPSAGKETNGGSGVNKSGVPTNNEWDTVLNKNEGNIPNYSYMHSWGQDSTASASRVKRAYYMTRCFATEFASWGENNRGYRPVLELPASGSLTVISLNLNGGRIGTTSGTVNMVVASGSSFTAPSGEGLRAPEDQSFHGWQDDNGVTYQAGASVPSTVTSMTAVWDESLPREDTPSIIINYADETLTGFIDGGRYTIDGKVITPINGTLAAADYMGKTISIVKLGQEGTTNSAARQLAVPARPSAPDVFAVDETAAGEKDGKITGASADMEYKLSTANLWLDCTGTEITGLAAGTYQVRTRATDTAFAGTAALVSVARSAEKIYTLNVTAPTFNEAVYGYTQPEPQVITITSIGNSDATISSVTVNGSFVIDGFGDTVTAGESISTWTIRPIAGLNVGTHTGTITVTYNNGAIATADVSFTVTLIERTPLTITCFADNADYTGKPYAGLTAPVAEGYSAGFDISYSNENGALSEAPVNAGSYTVTVTPTDRDNYTGSWSQAFVIAPLPLTVTAEDKQAVVGEPAPEYTAKVEGLVEGETITGIEFSIGGADLNTAGSYTITPGGGTVSSSNENYTITYVSGVLSVTKGNGGFHDSYKDCAGDETCPIRSFTDASATAWYHDGVHYCIENGLINGHGNGIWKPQGTLTRGMLTQILYNKAGRPAVSEYSFFDDVPPGAWYADAVNWAAKSGVVTGYGNGKFGPGNPITREQLATMLWRYAGSPESGGTLEGFADADKTSGYAVSALCWTVEKGIVSGKGGESLAPTGKATRAEVAAMLMRFCEMDEN